MSQGKEAIMGRKAAAKRIKIPSNVRTVDDLLAHDDVQHVLQGAYDERASMKHVTVIWHDRDDSLAWSTTLEPAEIVAELERVKFYVLLEATADSAEEGEEK